MKTTIDTSAAEQKARELLESRITSVRALVTQRAQLGRLRQEVADLELADAKAYKQAVGDGWTPDELRKLGIGEPAKTQRVRRRRMKDADSQTTQKPNAGSEQADNSGSQDAHRA